MEARLRLLWVGSVAALFAVPGALAAHGAFDIETRLPVTIDGSHTASAQDGAFVLTGDSGQASLLLSGYEGTLERVIHRAYGYLKQDDPQAGILWEQRVEVEELDLAGAAVTLSERGEDFVLLIQGPVAVHEGAHRGPLHVGALGESLTIRSEAEPPIELVVGDKASMPFVHTLPRGTLEARATDGLTMATGSLDIFIGDAALEYHPAIGQDRSLLAGTRLEEKSGAIYNPVDREWTGPGTHTEYVHEYLRFKAADAHVQVQFLATPATLFADAPQLATRGEATFPEASGTVTIEDDDATRHVIDGEDLTLAGDFSFVMDGRGIRSADATGSGDFTQVTYATESHSYPWGTIAAATGIGAVLVAIGVYVSGAGKWLLGGAGAGIAGYARVQGDAIMKHPGRAAVYERVKDEPGLHFVDLQKRLDFGASTLNYHLRVLERNDFVHRVKDGRYVRFFDARSGQYSSDRKHAASTLRNAQTAAIAGHIIEHPGIAQRDLAAVFGIAPSTVSWHVERLRKAELIEKQRDQHFTRYYMGDAWSDLPAQELARVGLVA